MYADDTVRVERLSINNVRAFSVRGSSLRMTLCANSWPSLGTFCQVHLLKHLTVLCCFWSTEYKLTLVGIDIRTTNAMTSKISIVYQMQDVFFG